MGKCFATLESSLARLASIAAFINAVIPSEILLLFGVSSKYFFFPKSPASAISRSINYLISEIQNTIKKNVVENLKIGTRLTLYK